MTETAFKSATEIAKMIREKSVSCREVLEHYIERVERFDGDLNAIPVRDFDRARERADAADAALARDEIWGPLHGVPMTIKESYDVAGLPTTWGLESLKDNIAAKDSVVVERMKAAGVTLFGKTNVPVLLSDWQSFNPVYGTTNNPWDTGRTPGGSSGGSSAALAAGLTAIESGSDIGASIRNPAHYCGVFGHKPTWGIVPPRGHATPGVITPSDISAVGPLARTAADLEVALDAMAGPYGHDAACWRLELPASTKTEPSDFKVAVMLTDPNCAQDDVLTAQLQATVDALAKLGVTVDERARPDFDSTEYHRMYIRLLRAATGGRIPMDQFNAQIALAESADPDDHGYAVLQARGTTARHRDWLADNERRNHYREAWAAFFEEYDLLLCPTAASTAFPHDQEGERMHRTIPVNGKLEPTTDQLFWAGLSGVAYLPATVAPAGLCSDGLPCGLQIVAPHGHDRRALAFAGLMERELGGFTPPPGY